MAFDIEKYNRDILTAFDHRLLTAAFETMERRELISHLQNALMEAMHIEEIRIRTEIQAHESNDSNNTGSRGK